MEGGQGDADFIYPNTYLKNKKQRPFQRCNFNLVLPPYFWSRLSYCQTLNIGPGRIENI